MSEDRRARTRTLIQLGGLVEKSGLMEVLEIEMGQDLQKDPNLFSKVAILGAIFNENMKILSSASDQEIAKWIKAGRDVLKGVSENGDV